MITFEQLGNYGRLGNQLFQYALLKSVSFETDRQIILPTNLYNKIWHNQKCLLNNFKLSSIKFLDKNFDFIYNEKDHMQYDENVFQIEQDTNYHGFFQNTKYFIKYIDEIRKEFDIKDEIKNKVIEYLKQFNKPVVSLHVRRGDSSDGTDQGLNTFTNNFLEKSLLYQYYSKALDNIPKECTILLFTGGSRFEDNKKDIEWCKNNFNDKRIVYDIDLNDMDTFCCMTLCDYNIISFLSTYSLWAAYLNKNQKCIAPYNFYPHLKIECKDLFFPNWTLL